MSELSIPSLILDPENEQQVILRAYETIRSSSNGLINDFSPSSPIAALVEGQAFVYMEMLWYLNQLPVALALESFRLLGIERTAGTTAKGSVTFLLSATLASNFVLPQGYFIPFRDAGFKITENLVIPAGSLEATVKVEATRVGSDMNIAAFGLTNLGASLTYLNNIYNGSPINGGSDIEPLKQTIDRAQIAIRSRDTLVTVNDYESVAVFMLGGDSYAKTYPLLEFNKTKETLGHLHVFLLTRQDDFYVAPSVATCQNIQTQLRDRSFVGASVWVSPASIKPVDIEVVVKAEYLHQDIVTDTYVDLLNYLSPNVIGIGSTIPIKEIEYIVRSVEGVTSVLTATIDRQSLNTPMPNKYTMPMLGNLAITIQDPTNVEETYYRSTIVQLPVPQ